ncbi:hypothetical protein A3A63_03695 [Candidatus Gottesmanbacteria bacterium RIFCSPLOWO2_01_FULL_46_9]|uniref:Uncharacterized protein n=1 Tax=Candidatus Gottesmanbacteria bacterium RIFCSPLOWO2_01_FULL_46_9 TaxID=1798394 RepID=A0A1F6AX55_9BACT|nr:MAG: hypothetical protein A3A63_03695 [Candidatus Gottesmanbacteria bacterium RIFCSPLOWO2_01_FULL_46_9]
MKTIQDLIHQANKLMEQEHYDEAEPLLLVVIKRDQKNPEAHYLLGEVYCKQQRFAESVTVLEKANRLLPGNPNIIRLLGWATFMNGDIERGREHMKKALTKTPNDIRHLCDFAVLEMHNHNYVAAKTYARTAMNLAPNDDMVQEVNAAIDAFGAAYHHTLQKN